MLLPLDVSKPIFDMAQCAIFPKRSAAANFFGTSTTNNNNDNNNSPFVIKADDFAIEINYQIKFSCILSAKLRMKSNWSVEVKGKSKNKSKEKRKQKCNWQVQKYGWKHSKRTLCQYSKWFAKRWWATWKTIWPLNINKSSTAVCVYFRTLLVSQTILWLPFSTNATNAHSHSARAHRVRVSIDLNATASIYRSMCNEKTNAKQTLYIN